MGSTENNIFTNLKNDQGVVIGDDCWGITRKIRIITLTQEEFSTRSGTQLGRKEFEMLSANGTSPKKV
jgi:hypothetical protein